MKRFIECSGYIVMRNVKIGASIEIRMDRWMNTISYVDIKSIKSFYFLSENFSQAPSGWYIITKKYHYHIKNQEDVDMLINLESDNVGNDIRHLTKELSYNPGRIGAGSEFLQAVKRQADNFSI